MEREATDSVERNTHMQTAYAQACLCTVHMTDAAWAEHKNNVHV